MPHIEYLCHSCVVIRTSDTSLVFDPWISGPAYKGQWHLFPKPVDITSALGAENILITHGHEDHMHKASLDLLRPDAHVFFPFQWRNGIREHLRNIGFDRITEAITLKRYQVSPNTTVTYFAYSLESIVVIEADGQVIVNLNDALNSNHENVVMMFLRELKKRWPRIDVLLSGMSGAGYFPNQVRFPGKDDREVGEVREQYFAHNLCKYLHYLQPRLAVPFAPGFALVSKGNRWINEVKFPREKLADYYAEHFAQEGELRPEIVSIYPGDTIEGVSVTHSSPYGPKVRDGSLAHLIDHDLASEIREADHVADYPPEALAGLRQRTEQRINGNIRLYDDVVLADAVFSIRLTDVEGGRVWNVRRTNGHFSITEDKEPMPEARTVITTRASLLELGVDRLWGGDAMTIGYGLTVDVFTEDSLEKNLDIVCVRLITYYPVTRDDIWKQPLRAFRYFSTNPLITGLHLRQKVKLKPFVNKFPYNERDHWISYTKCDLCKVCNIPQLVQEVPLRS